MTDELQHLYDTVENVRAEATQTLDPQLLKAVIEAEEAHPDDDAAALAAIETAVRAVLDREAAS
jgi:hypothetical protein